jgi:hypothetical protein
MSCRRAVVDDRDASYFTHIAPFPPGDPLPRLRSGVATYAHCMRRELERRGATDGASRVERVGSASSGQRSTRKYRMAGIGHFGRFTEDLRSHFSPALNRPQNRDSGQRRLAVPKVTTK